MPLFSDANAGRLARDLDRDSYALFHGVPLPGEHFNSAAGECDVLIKARTDGRSYIVLLDAGVRYVGDNGDYRDAFKAEPHRGWRPLAIVEADSAAGVLRQTDRVLGLAGRPPRMRPTSAPEIVVRTTEIDPAAAPEQRDEQRFGIDLVAEARAGRLTPPLFREKEIDALVRILCKAGKNAACLVGPPGAGKTAIAEGLAVRIASDRVPAALKNAQVLDVNLSLLAAGATFRNEFEGRVKQLLDVARSDPNVILFLDEVHTLASPGSDASQMVKSDLGRGRIRCVGATTNAEMRILEKDEALARRFQLVPVEEPSPAQTVEILRAARGRFEEHHGVMISDELIERVVTLAVRYVPDRHLPDKALDLLDEACACASLDPAVPPQASKAGSATGESSSSNAEKGEPS